MTTAKRFLLALVAVATLAPATAVSAAGTDTPPDDEQHAELTDEQWAVIDTLLAPVFAVYVDLTGGVVVDRDTWLEMESDRAQHGYGIHYHYYVWLKWWGCETRMYWALWNGQWGYHPHTVCY